MSLELCGTRPSSGLDTWHLFSCEFTPISMAQCLPNNILTMRLWVMVSKIVAGWMVWTDYWMLVVGSHYPVKFIELWWGRSHGVDLWPPPYPVTWEQFSVYRVGLAWGARVSQFLGPPACLYKQWSICIQVLKTFVFGCFRRWADLGLPTIPVCMAPRDTRVQTA